MDAQDIYNLYSAYISVYEDREYLSEDVDYELEEGYKKLPIASMLKQASRHGENVGRSGGDQESSLKRAKRVGRMMSAAERHDPVKSQAKAYSNFGRADARQQNEELDLYDVVLDHLLDEGYCDDVESAEIIMANMSEEWVDCILEKADNTIRLVYGKGGKGVPFGNDGNVLRTPNVGFDKQGDSFRQATRDAARRFARKASKKIDSQDGVDARLSATQRKNITRLNAKPNVGTPEKDEKWHVQPEDKTSYYPEVPTDYRARRRRASGR